MAGIEVRRPEAGTGAGRRRRTASTIQTRPCEQPPGVFVRGADYYAQGPVNR
ncbi:MAG: hypothetical protein V9G10_03750 [Candidatus Nanopelagicales bacterium]